MSLIKYLQYASVYTLCGAFMSITPHAAHAAKGGISFGTSTRVIFHSDDKRVSFPAQNDTDQPLVFHGQVLTKDKLGFSPDFIVAPEVVHLQPGETKFVQIVQLNNRCPDDRESLFYLRGHFIPASDQSESSQGVGISTSYVMTMKMFFRPAKLKDDYDAIDDVAHQLDFKVSNNTLTVFNQSAYYLTLNSMRSEKGDIPVPNDGSMIEPFGQTEIEIKDPSINSIAWTLLNDGGFATKPFTKKL